VIHFILLESLVWTHRQPQWKETKVAVEQVCGRALSSEFYCLAVTSFEKDKKEHCHKPKVSRSGFF